MINSSAFFFYNQKELYDKLMFILEKDPELAQIYDVLYLKSLEGILQAYSLLSAPEWGMFLSGYISSLEVPLLFLLKTLHYDESVLIDNVSILKYGLIVIARYTLKKNKGQKFDELVQYTINRINTALTFKSPTLAFQQSLIRREIDGTL